jgi:hypothetical protein
LGALREGAALLLAPDAAGLDLLAVARAEQATASVGVEGLGLRRLDR